MAHRGKKQGGSNLLDLLGLVEGIYRGFPATVDDITGKTGVLNARRRRSVETAPGKVGEPNPESKFEHAKGRHDGVSSTRDQACQRSFDEFPIPTPCRACAAVGRCASSG